MLGPIVQTLTNSPTLCPIITFCDVRCLYLLELLMSFLRGFSTYSGAYGSHTIGQRVGPLVHCYIDSNFHWLWISKSSQFGVVHDNLCRQLTIMRACEIFIQQSFSDLYFLPGCKITGFAPFRDTQKHFWNGSILTKISV